MQQVGSALHISNCILGIPVDELIKHTGVVELLVTYIVTEIINGFQNAVLFTGNFYTEEIFLCIVWLLVYGIIVTLHEIFDIKYGMIGFFNKEAENRQEAVHLLLLEIAQHVRGDEITLLENIRQRF